MPKSDPSAFEYIARLKFATHLRYTTDHKPDDVMSEGYFNNSAMNYLAAGDEVDVVCIHEDGSWTKGRVEVTQTGQEGTVVELIGEWRSAGGTEAREKRAIHTGYGKWKVVDHNNVTLAKGLTKDEAHALANDEPKVEEAA